MDSDSTVAVSGGGDRLSRLGDAALGHILSFLPATEAARTATLSRRWRHVFAAVHSLSFAEAEAPLRMGYEWWRRCDDSGEMRAPCFVTGVTTALNGRHRGASAATAPLRALRVAFDEFGFRGGDDATRAVDGWLSYAVHGAGDALEIDLRLGTDPICDCDWAYALDAHWHDSVRNMDMDYEMAQGQDDDDAAADGDDGHDDYSGTADGELGPVETDEYVVPRSLFSSCAALRALRLGRCRIDLPSAIALPSLDTLHLTRVTGAIQRLVSACPSLADLTLEACVDLTALSVGGAARFRRLALRCCHRLGTVVVGSTTELRALEYGDATLPASFLVMDDDADAGAAAPRRIPFCAFDFCGVEQHGGTELLGGLAALLAGVERLHLTSARLGSCLVGSHGGASASLWLPMLHNLEITGMLPDGDESAGVSTVARILERTPRLETLSLFFLPEPQAVKNCSPFSVSVHKEVLNSWHDLKYDPHARLAVADDVEIPGCLRETTREMNLVHYQGSLGQRALAKFLLCNAPKVEEVCWKVARGPLSIQTKLMEEIKGWVMNKSANTTFF